MKFMNPAEGGGWQTGWARQAHLREKGFVASRGGRVAEVHPVAGRPPQPDACSE